MPAPVEELTREEVELDADQLGDLSFLPPPMKHSDTRDSISSIDSDISLSYDLNAENTATSADDEGAHLADLSDSGSDNGSLVGKDSGCEAPPQEDSEPPFIPPDEELANRIVAQVEFYFSDVNITKDAFLLKHVKRNKEGYVSLKLISSFKRVKHLAKDWRVVAYALQRSTKLQINEAGTKLRRLDPLPAYDQTTPSRTVVAMNLPNDKPTIENVADLFSCYGDIALVRILRPGNPVPADVRNFVAKRPELAGTVCALVEFVTTECAHKAAKGSADWRGHSQGITVVELNAPAPAAPKKRGAGGKKTAVSRLVDNEYSSSCASSSEAEPDFRQRQRRASSPARTPWQRRLSMRRDSSDSSCSSGFFGRPRSNSTVSGDGGFSRSRSNSGFSSDGGRSRSNSGVHMPENVVRLPKGPDGSRGFRPRLASIAGC